MYFKAATCAISGMLLCVRYKKQFDSFLQRLYNCMNSLVNPIFYVFFDEYSMPFPAHSLNLDRTLAATPTLVYNADTSVFFPYFPNMSFAEVLAQHKPVALPILSLEIIDASGRCVRDLTGFIETVRYVHIVNYPAPAISDIIAIWSVTNSIPVDRDRFRIRYITTDGDEVDVPLTDASILDDEMNPTNVNAPNAVERITEDDAPE